MLNRLKEVELILDIETRKINEQKLDLVHDKRRLEEENFNYLSERQELLQQFTQFKVYNSKQLEEKTIALNLYKQEIKIAADESNHRKALLEVADSSVYKLNHENQDLRSK